MAQAHKAKVFRNGRSQAVRIPAEFRFTSNEVYIERDEKTGAVMLSERPVSSTMADLFARIDAAGGFEFDLERDERAPETREEW